MIHNEGYSINIGGKLLTTQRPLVMGILNATPDSFYAPSRAQDSDEIAEKARELQGQGADIIDIGACSTRPGSTPPTEEEECRRLLEALQIVRQTLPEMPLSIDTYRAEVAKQAIELYGPMIINDVSGLKDPQMADLVAQAGVPYVLTSQEATIKAMLLTAAKDIATLRAKGVKDIIFDPGIGFGKSNNDDWKIMAELEKLNILQLPILIGISRKSLLQTALNTAADDTLHATTALNAAAIMKGAAILRVHDPLAARQTITIMQHLND